MSIQKLSTTTGAGSTAPSAGRFAQTSGGTITTYTSGGVTYQVQSFTASGTLTVGSSGVVDIQIKHVLIKIFVTSKSWFYKF